MRPVTPPTDNLPDNVMPARFDPPDEVKDEVNPIVGLVHKDEQGQPLGLEFMFELTKDEITVLRHEPYLTITMMSDHLHPFALQTSFEPDKKYAELMEHNHICNSNITHANQKWWRCDNPTHNSEQHRLRQCDECWEAALEESYTELATGDAEEDEPTGD